MGTHKDELDDLDGFTAYAWSRNSTGFPKCEILSARPRLRAVRNRYSHSNDFKLLAATELKKGMRIQDRFDVTYEEFCVDEVVNDDEARELKNQLLFHN